MTNPHEHPEIKASRERLEAQRLQHNALALRLRQACPHERVLESRGGSGTLLRICAVCGHEEHGQVIVKMPRFNGAGYESQPVKPKLGTDFAKPVDAIEFIACRTLIY
jgi:hypothetical protein